MSKHLKNNSSDCNSTPSKICSGFFLPGACCFFVILFNISISWVPVQTLIMHESIDADFSGWKSLSTFSIQCGFVVCSELKANVSHCISHRPYSTNFKVVEKEKKLSAQVTLTSLFFYFSSLGNLSKTCTADGWTEMQPVDIAVNCGYNLNSTNDDVSERPPFVSCSKRGWRWRCSGEPCPESVGRKNWLRASFLFSAGGCTWGKWPYWSLVSWLQDPPPIYSHQEVGTFTA